MNSESDCVEIKNIRFARQELDKERAHRREKVWKIFSWAATILVAITGGVIAIKTSQSGPVTFSCYLNVVLIGAVVILMGFGSLWIEQNLDILHKTEKAIAKCDKDLGIKQVVPNKPPKFGYKWALTLLGIAAIISIVIKV